MQIICPDCGPRDQYEFTWGADARIERPAEPSGATDDTWSAYLYYRLNAAGPASEHWCHLYGCGKWFVLTRDTVTGRIAAP